MGFEDYFYNVLEENTKERGGASKINKLTGISLSSLSQIKRKAKLPTIKTIAKILDALEEETYTEGPRIKAIGSNAPVETVEGANMEILNVYNVVGAGSAFEITKDDPLCQMAVPAGYFRRSDYAVLVDGHSMEPLIPNGSVVGIKLGSNFIADEIYVANLPYEGWVIKRIGFDRATNEYIFKSENPNKVNYPDFRLNINESENVIVGRVVWVLWGY